MSLKSSLKEINDNKANAAMDLMLGNPDTYNGRSGLKRAATEAVRRGKAQYHKDLLDTMAYIVVTGSGRDQFTELASSETFGCFAGDPEEFFKNIVSRLDQKLFGRETPRNFFNIVSNILEDKMLEIGIVEYNPLTFSDKYNSAVNKPEDLVLLVRNAITDQIGAEIVGINSVSSLVDKAIEKGHDFPVTPVLFSTGDEKFALELRNGLKRKETLKGVFKGLSSKVFLVVVGNASKELKKTQDVILVKTVSDESVGEALSSIRNKIL